MNNDIKYTNNPRNGKALAGIVLLIVGGLLLLKQFRVFFIPDDVDLWPLWLVGWGLFICARNNFTKPSSFMLILIGVVLFIVNNVNGASGVVWPLAIIAFGLWMILRRHHRFDKDYWEKQYSGKWGDKNNTGQN